MDGLTHGPARAFGGDAAATPGGLLQSFGSLVGKLAGAARFAAECSRELNRRGEISPAALARISDLLARAR